jgi:DNA-binding NarL/FixJ family response regulator
MMKRVRVLLIDDHDMVRLGLSIMLEACEEIELVGETGSPSEVFSLYQQTQPDVVLMDLHLPETNGIQLTRQLKQLDPDARVIALTNYSDSHLVQEALTAGVTSYLLKNVKIDMLRKTILCTAQGQSILSEEVSQVLVKMFLQPKPDHYALSLREMEILSMVVQGLSNAQIAQRLVLGETTVKKHMGNILHKLGLHSRAEAAVWAVRNGWVTLAKRG